MRFNSQITLVSVNLVQQANGSFKETETKTDVFANRRSIGASVWAAERSIGLHADAEVQIRTCDYNGAQNAILDGTEYSIERVSTSGDFCILTLTNRLANQESEEADE